MIHDDIHVAYPLRKIWPKLTSGCMSSCQLSDHHHGLCSNCSYAVHCYSTCVSWSESVPFLASRAVISTPHLKKLPQLPRYLRLLYRVCGKIAMKSAKMPWFSGLTSRIMLMKIWPVHVNGRIVEMVVLRVSNVHQGISRGKVIFFSDSEN